MYSKHLILLWGVAYRSPTTYQPYTAAYLATFSPVGSTLPSPFHAIPCVLVPQPEPLTLADLLVPRSVASCLFSRDCVGNEGLDGCFTDDIPECRTCYLSVEIYMDAFNITEPLNVPDWVMCPCCVPATLQANHTDIEVQKDGAYGGTKVTPLPRACTCHCGLRSMDRDVGLAGTG